MGFSSSTTDIETREQKMNKRLDLEVNERIIVYYRLGMHVPMVKLHTDKKNSVLFLKLVN
jgi:hypothetical protein